METLVYIALGTIAITLAVALYLSPTTSLGYRPLISGYTIVLYAMVIYTLLSASVPIFLNDMVSFDFPDYSSPSNFLGTLVVCWLGVLLYAGFYHFFSRKRPMSAVAKSIVVPGRAFFPAISYGLVAFGVLLKFLFVLRSGGLHVLLVTRSHGIANNLGYTDEIDRLAVYLASFSFMGDAAACWLFLNAVRLRKSVPLHTVIVAATLAMTFLITPKREVLIAPAIALLTGFSIYVRPLRLGHAPLFLVTAVALSMMTLVSRIILPAYLANIPIAALAQWGTVRLFAVRLLSADINFFDTTLVAVYGADHVIAKFGDWWDAFYRPNIEPLTYFVPRAIWPSKPDAFADVGTAVMGVETGSTLTYLQGGLGVSLVATSWMYGGFVGLVLGMALLGRAASFVDRFLEKAHRASPGRILTFSVSCTALFLLFRQGTLGYTFLDLFQYETVFFLTVIALTMVAARK